VISILQKRDLFSILFLAILLFATRVAVFPGLHTLPAIQVTPFYQWLSGIMDFPDAVNFIIVNLLLIAHAVLIKLLCATHGIIQSKTWLPGIMYLLLAGIFPWQYALQPHLFTTLLLLLTIYKISNFYEAELQIEKKLMDIGFIFCFFPLVSVEGWYFLIFIALTISFFIFYDINKIFLLLMSIVVPIILFASVTYVFGNGKMLNQFLIAPIQNMDIPHLMSNRIVFGPLSYPAILGGFGALMMQNRIGSIPSKVRKIYYTFFTLIVLEVLILVLRKNNFNSNATLFALPLSIFVAYFFNHLKTKWLGEVLFAVFLVLILFTQLVLSKFA
jgi:hypothetical protein